MNDKMPHTPFSTGLSRSAKETKIRLQNIFSGPKKRPPVLFLALMCLIALSCGDLVSCQVKEAEAPDVSDQPASSRQGDGLLDSEEQALLDALFQAAEQERDYPFQIPTISLLNSMEKDGWALGVVFVEDHLENTLILGVMDEASGRVLTDVFQCSYHGGIPNVVTFQDDNGDYCVLYTFNGQMNGQYYGEAGMYVFDGIRMVRKWPSAEDAPDGNAGYWYGHLAVMAPGGVDVYTVDPEFEWGQDEPWSRWQLDHGETFYQDPSSAEALPMPVYFQSLRWLIDRTNDPGGWQILSLVRSEERCDPEDQVDCFTLQARDWIAGEELTADLFFPYELNTAITRVYGDLDHAEMQEEICGYPPAPPDGP